MAFQEQQGAISSNTAPNYDVSAKPGWDVCAELCSLVESFRQGHPPVFRDAFSTKTFSKQRQSWGHPAKKATRSLRTATLTARFPNPCRRREGKIAVTRGSRKQPETNLGP
jgi:hypothetical protein